MAVDVQEICDPTRGILTTQSLGLVLSVVFAVYVAVDTLLGAFVLIRKTRGLS